MFYYWDLIKISFKKKFHRQKMFPKNQLTYYQSCLKYLGLKPSTNTYCVGYCRQLS